MRNKNLYVLFVSGNDKYLSNEGEGLYEQIESSADLWRRNGFKTYLVPKSRARGFYIIWYTSRGADLEFLDNGNIIPVF